MRVQTYKVLTRGVIDDVGEGSVEVQYVGIILVPHQVFYIVVVHSCGIVCQKVACRVVVRTSPQRRAANGMHVVH